MPVSETDLELLETYLDEALPPSQVEAVRRRLAGELELSSALTELNSQRTAARPLSGPRSNRPTLRRNR